MLHVCTYLGMLVQSLGFRQQTPPALPRSSCCSYSGHRYSKTHCQVHGDCMAHAFQQSLKSCHSQLQMNILLSDSCIHLEAR